MNGNVKATAFILTSDQRLKKNIRPVQGLEAILKLRGVRYEWKADNKTEIGLIAQEVEEVFPEAVATSAKDGFKGVKYQNLISPMIEATKELYGMCKAQERGLASVQESTRQLWEENAKLKEHTRQLDKENRKLKEEFGDLNRRMKHLEEVLLKSSAK